MESCHCQAIEKSFDRENAEKKARQYHEDGVKKETGILIDALLEEGVEMSSLLDIGGGIGAIEIELLKAGASEAVNVEASSAYLEVAEEEATRQGLSDQISHTHGNFVDLAPYILPADIVTLDKVICCFDDFENLVKFSAQKAQKLFGVIYPRDTWWVKVVNAFDNLLSWIQRSDFRVFVHPVERIDQIVRDDGLKLIFSKNHIEWQIVVYRRK